MLKKITKVVLPLLLIIAILTACDLQEAKDSIGQAVESIANQAEQLANDILDGAKDNTNQSGDSTDQVHTVTGLESIPAYTNDAYIAINGNVPYFTEDDKARTDAFESYSELDNLGRCGVAYANICPELMPTEERGEIGMIKPSGWTYDGESNNNKYDWVDGKYIYNRCHIIGFQLAGENANEKNLLTGTRYLNLEGNLPFENLVADYVHETGNHVLYRVTPIYEGSNPLCSGELMEGWSVEDNGEGICFCVYAYNVQPGVKINYSTGQNWAE